MHETYQAETEVTPLTLKTEVRLRCVPVYLSHPSSVEGVFSARCNIYISHLSYDAIVRLVCPSVCDVCVLWSQSAMDPAYLCMLG